MTSPKNSDTIDVDEILGSLKYTFDQPNNELKLPEPLTPQSPSPQPFVAEISLQPEQHVEIKTKPPVSGSDDTENTLLKLKITELETQLANLSQTHQQSIDKYSAMNVAYLENQNAELRYNLAEKVQTINELTSEIETLENLTLETNKSNDHDERIKALEEHNSTLLAENLTYHVQAAETQEEMYYREREIKRMRLELEHQRELNNELNDQISVLQIQLANWRIDFEKEREDRAALASDRDTILTQLKYAQKRSEQLENGRYERTRPNNESCMMM